VSPDRCEKGFRTKEGEGSTSCVGIHFRRVGLKAKAKKRCTLAGGTKLSGKKKRNRPE